MSLFNRLCSAFRSSVEDVISELSERTNGTSNTTNQTKTETNPPTVEKSTSAPIISDDMIKEYVFNGEIKSGSQIMVSSDEMVVLIKDGNIVDLLPSGVYILNDSNVSYFTTGCAYSISLKESTQIKWGTAKPVSFNDSTYGMLSLRLNGAYSYRICDIVKAITEYIKSESSFSFSDYTREFLVIPAVERAVSNCNITSYAEIQNTDFSKLIENELLETGINFTVNTNIATLTEDSKKVIEQYMKEKLFNNQ